MVEYYIMYPLLQAVMWIQRHNMKGKAEFNQQILFFKSEPKKVANL